jgi:hypothetical protein
MEPKPDTSVALSNDCTMSTGNSMTEGGVRDPGLRLIRLNAG